MIYNFQPNFTQCFNAKNYGVNIFLFLRCFYFISCFLYLLIFPASHSNNVNISLSDCSWTRTQNHLVRTRTQPFDHLFEWGFDALNWFFTAHVTFVLRVSCFKFQYSTDNFVSLLYLMMLNDLLCFEYRLLNVFSLILINFYQQSILLCF